MRTAALIFGLAFSLSVPATANDSLMKVADDPNNWAMQSRTAVVLMQYSIPSSATSSSHVANWTPTFGLRCLWTSWNSSTNRYAMS